MELQFTLHAMKHVDNLGQDEVLLQQLTQTVLNNLENEQFGVEELSEQIGMSRSHLHRKLKLLKGKSVSQFIREIRLEEAMQLLQNDVATAAEIAYRVGFSSSSYFHKCFHDHYGCSPGEVKKRTVDEPQDLETEDVSIEEKEPQEINDQPLPSRPAYHRSRIFTRKIVLPLVIVLLSVILIGYYFYPSRQTYTSIAVLPLQNFTGDPEQEYFVNGLHNALTVTLGQISTIRVISSTSARHYRQSDMLLQEIARELGVDVIVEGSVLGSGNQVRIQLQLIEAFPEERQLWSKEYQQDLRNILSLQSDVVRHIAREIHITLTPQEETLLANTPVVNPDAYKASLNGMYHCDKHTEEGFNTAMQYFDFALKLDPNYALAYAGISRVWLGRMQDGVISYVEGVPKMAVAALKAFELDSTLSEVHYLLGVSNCYYDWNYKEGEKELRKAIALNPNFSLARAILSHALNFLHQPDKAMEQIEMALKSDPFNPLIQSLYGMNLNFTRQFDKAIDLFGNTLKSEPTYPMALSTLRTTYHLKGMYEEALEVWKESYEIKGDHKAVEALELGEQTGGYQGALEHLAQLLIARSDTTYITPWQIGTLYTRAGMKDEALTWLEKAYDAHDSNMPYIGVDPIFDILRDEPHFQNLLKKMNLPLEEHPLANL